MIIFFLGFEPFGNSIKLHNIILKGVPVTQSRREGIKIANKSSFGERRRPFAIRVSRCSNKSLFILSVVQFAWVFLAKRD